MVRNWLEKVRTTLPLSLATQERSQSAPDSEQIERMHPQPTAPAQKGQGGKQRFFDLFAFYYNVRNLRAGKREGNSLLASAHVDVKKLFGTDDPYTILGFPPASQTFTLVKSVQSVAG